MALCSFCRALSLDQMRGPELDRMQRHQPSYLALKRSVENGCQLCKFLWMALEQGAAPGEDGYRAALSHVSERYPGREISLVAWGGPGRTLDRIHITTTGSVPSSPSSAASDEDGPSDPTMHPDHQMAVNGVVDLYAYPDDPAAWHGGINGRPLPQTAGSDEDFELVTEWLQDCLCKHEACSRVKETSLPSRVIDIGQCDGSMEPYLLVSNRRTGTYLTLSHCWGGKLPLTTTSSTLEERKQSIPFTSLPKTFQEAVITTRKLGIRYLWIDALCIIQDSRTDWEKESAVMGDIYASSYLNVAARGAPNAEVGCFIPRKAEPPACRLEYRSADGSVTGSMYVRSPVFRPELLRDAPLDNRAWVLQERLLSPRILYFGSQQLYWECAETALRQDGKHHLASNDDLRANHFKAFMDFNAVIPKAHGQDQAARYLQWYNVVTDYTRRTLTFDSDKLPAISGVAKDFHSRTGCTYIAGIWQEDLVAGILWFKSKPSEPISHTLPSWSWARLKSPVHFWNPTMETPMVLDSCCKVIEVTYQLTGLNPYGDITGAQLRIEGQLIQIAYTPEALKNTTAHLDRDIWTLDERPVGYVKFDTAPPPYESVFFCLLVCNRVHRSAALALKLLKHRAVTYERLGYVTIYTNDVGIDGRTPFWESESQILSII